MVGVSHCGLASRPGGHTGGWWSPAGGQERYQHSYSIFDLKHQQQQQQQHQQQQQQQHKEDEGITIYRVETPLSRAVRALPLLLISVFAYQVWCLQDAVPVAKDWLRIGRVVFEEHGKDDVEIVRIFFGWRWLDELLALANVFFLPAVYNLRPPAQEQLVSFLAESGVVLFIMWYESVKNWQRNQGGWFFSVVPVLFTLAGQVVGLGVALPVYLFLSYVFSGTPREFMRVGKDDMMAIILAITLGHYVPAAGMFFDSMERRQGWLFIWQLYPLWVAITFHSLSAVLPRLLGGREEDEAVGTSSTSLDLRVSVGLVAAAGCLVREWQVVSSQRGIADVFWPNMLPGELLPDFAAFCAELLKWDQFFVFGSVLLWLAHSLGDMQEYGMVCFNRGWVTVGVLTGSVIGGPGLAAALLWLAKEEALLGQ
ncbi:hypothetical protein B0T21DRAFT_112997 [Apiosordaria backusii]|uniref:Uncharacterized protein n=1 Tax=Apiosordaria backusii TaxID=314023 RepID=A0AA40DIY9_9PEZI|nr:hypothetical protein B0T21DRAFT_112997 [Apiosordaria backusii]